MVKMRLDELLVERGIAKDRKEAEALVLRGVVLVNEQRVEKPGTLLEPSSEFRVKPTSRKYVSRGGIKLEAALRQFGVRVRGKACIDLGASTGGFTHCLLQHGAKRVYAFDVGRGQLDWKLRNDPRVVVRESTNVRYLRPTMVDELIDLVTVDLAFISLRLVLPSIREFSGATTLALVKPQFEARREEVGAGGIIRSLSLQTEIVGRVKDFAIGQGFTLWGEMPSPLRGQKGNREYFLFLRHQPSGGS